MAAWTKSPEPPAPAGKGGWCDNSGLVGALFFLLVFAAKAPALSTPYFWDELGAYVQPTFWLLENGPLSALPGLHPTGQFYGHPPGFYLSLALFFAVFGATPLAAHLYSVSCAFLGVLATYLLARRLAGGAAGVIAGLLLFFSPFYFAQAGLATSDIVTAAFAVLSVYFALSGRTWAYLASAVYLVMAKEAAIAAPFAIAIYMAVSAPRGERGRALATHAAPLALFAVWITVQKTATGHFIDNNVINAAAMVITHPLGWPTTFEQYNHVANLMYFHQFRFLGAALIGADFVIHGRAAWRKEYWLFALLSASFAGPFLFIYFLPRYILPVLPFFCVMTAVSLARLIPGAFGRAYVAALIVLIFAWRGTSPAIDATYGPDVDLSYADLAKTFAQAAAFVEARHPGQAVLTGWPLNSILTDPRLGYVGKALVVSDTPPADGGVLVSADRMDRPQDLQAVLDRVPHCLEARFGQPGKSVSVYILSPKPGDCPAR